jgi:transcriptional regulator with XRE-family HTH domain
MKLYKYNNRCNISGIVIREQRSAAGLSQEQLAARLQVEGLAINQKQISRIETGERVVADFELMFFAKVLSISFEQMLGN